MSAENIEARDKTSRINPIHYPWIGLPLILIFLGGLVGGALGDLVVGLNYQFFQQKVPLVHKYLITGAATVIAGVLYLVIIAAITMLFRN